MKHIYGKNVLLTGGSSGIGMATAELFAKCGYTVYSASRNPKNVRRVFDGGGEIIPVTLDVRDIESVKRATESILTQSDTGIVIHCAGVGIACAGEEFNETAINDLMDTNFNGVLRVNNYVLPHLRKRGSGLCIIVGSVGGVFPIPFQSYYCASKAALDLYSASLGMELHKYGVKVSLVMPGDTNTGFTGARKYEIDESSPYYEDCVRAVGKMEKDELAGKSPESVARVMLNLCSQKKPPARVTVGFDYKMLTFMRRLLPNRFVLFLLRKVYCD